MLALVLSLHPRSSFYLSTTLVKQAPPPVSGYDILICVMNMNYSFSHPEIELRPTVHDQVFSSLPVTSKASPGTILDLLEVYSDRVNLTERLDHTSLINHFQVGSL